MPTYKAQLNPDWPNAPDLIESEETYATAQEASAACEKFIREKYHFEVKRSIENGVCESWHVVWHDGIAPIVRGAPRWDLLLAKIQRIYSPEEKAQLVEDRIRMKELQLRIRDLEYEVAAIMYKDDPEGMARYKARKDRDR